MIELVKNMWTNPGAYRKLWVALAGALVVAATQGLIPDPVGAWVTIIVPVLTAGGVYQVRNEKEAEVEANPLENEPLTTEGS